MGEAPRDLTGSGGASTGNVGWAGWPVPSESNEALRRPRGPFRLRRFVSAILVVVGIGLSVGSLLEPYWVFQAGSSSNRIDFFLTGCSASGPTCTYAAYSSGLSVLYGTMLIVVIVGFVVAAHAVGLLVLYSFGVERDRDFGRGGMWVAGIAAIPLLVAVVAVAALQPLQFNAASFPGGCSGLLQSPSSFFWGTCAANTGGTSVFYVWGAGSGWYLGLAGGVLTLLAAIHTRRLLRSTKTATP